jgi:hypothetical protein
MGYMAEAMVQMHMKNYNGAIKLLSAHVSDPDLKESSRITLMEWIAECLCKGGDRTRAGMWFEKAAKSALSCDELPRFDKRKRTLDNIEKAFEAYSSENNIGGIKRVSVIKHSLSNPEWYIPQR